MATFNLKRFSKPSVLRHIDESRLLEFLAPHREFFAEKGLILPEVPTEGAISFHKLCEILMKLGAGGPEGLREALYEVHEMSSPSGVNRLREDARMWGFELEKPDSSSPEDLAIQVYLQDPEALRRSRRQLLALRRRSFQSFKTLRLSAEPADPTPELLAEMAGKLDDWFDDYRRGRGCRIEPFTSGEDLFFLVRHGEPIRREGVVEGAHSTSISFRPERFDVVVFDRKSRRLRINAQTEKERNEYRRLFGRYLFGDTMHFSDGGHCFTLEPLRNSGSKCLECHDVEGIEWIRLVEVSCFFGGKFKGSSIYRATDLFEDMHQRERSLPDRGKLSSAKLSVRFTDSDAPRIIVIQPPDRIQCTRNEDAVAVERWMEKHGFAV